MSDIDFGTIKVPGWLPGAADLLIDQAEEFLGTSDGKTRKQWVMDTLKGLARAHDIHQIPDWIERPLEDALISLVIETIFAFKYKRLTEQEKAHRALNRQRSRTEKKKMREIRRAERRAAREAKKAEKEQQEAEEG